MIKHTQTTPHLLHVSNFDDLINTPFKPPINAISWSRELAGDFEEIIHAIDFEGNILELDEEDLMALNLSEAGKTARTRVRQRLHLAARRRHQCAGIRRRWIYLIHQVRHHHALRR